MTEAQSTRSRLLQTRHFKDSVHDYGGLRSICILPDPHLIRRTSTSLIFALDMLFYRYVRIMTMHFSPVQDLIGDV